MVNLCYNGGGPEKSVRAREINSYIGVSDASCVMIHDVAHCDHWLIEDAHKIGPYAKDAIYLVIKAVYSQFSRSPHKERHMMALLESWGAEDLFRKLQYLFEVACPCSKKRKLRWRIKKSLVVCSCSKKKTTLSITLSRCL